MFTGEIDIISTNFKAIDVLVVEGLYSVKIEGANLKVFIENTYHETMEEQILSGKKNLMNSGCWCWKRQYALPTGQALADFYLDFDTASEIFHYVDWLISDNGLLIIRLAD